MVNEDIVIERRISERYIEVDRANVDAIEKMYYSIDIRGIRSFLVSIDCLFKEKNQKF